MRKFARYRSEAGSESLTFGFETVCLAGATLFDLSEHLSGGFFHDGFLLEPLLEVVLRPGCRAEVRFRF